MIMEIGNRGKTYFQCSECGLYYKNKDMAKKCENFCKKYKSCNLDIIKHAVKLKI